MRRLYAIVSSGVAFLGLLDPQRASPRSPAVQRRDNVLERNSFVLPDVLPKRENFEWRA